MQRRGRSIQYTLITLTPEKHQSTDSVSIVYLTTCSPFFPSFPPFPSNSRFFPTQSILRLPCTSFPCKSMHQSSKSIKRMNASRSANERNKKKGRYRYLSSPSCQERCPPFLDTHSEKKTIEMIEIGLFQRIGAHDEVLSIGLCLLSK